MNFQAYVAQAHDRLLALGFADLPVPPDLTGRFLLAVRRQESWGQLILLLTDLDRRESAERSNLAAIAGAWVRNLQAGSDSSCYGVVTFPFSSKVPDELADSIRTLRVEDPHQRWGIIPWVADLELELIDRHSGAPRVDNEVVVALADVPRGRAESYVRKATGPRIGRRSPWFGNLGDMPASRFILGATISYFLWTVLWSVFMGYGRGLLGSIMSPSGLVLDMWGANDPRLILGADQNWRFLTALILHAGLLHILFNMWAFWSLGRNVELIYGSARMTFIYIVSGVIGGVAGVMLRPVPTLSVGASGAIMGLMGALIYFAMALPRQRVDWRSLLSPVAFTLLYGFIVPYVDNYAHIGGLIGGFVAAFLVGVPGERRLWRTIATVVVGVAVLVLVTGIVHLPYPFLGL